MRRTARLRIASLALGVAVATAGLTLVSAPAAEAATIPDVTGGQVTWGIKSSFRSYLVGPVAQGAITTSAGASQATGNGAFRFPVVDGTSDIEAIGDGATTAASVGAIALTGHSGFLEVRLTDVRVQLTGTTGTLVADATSRPYRGGTQTAPAAPVTYDDIALASLDLTGISPSSTSTGNVWSNIPAKLTPAGVPVLADFYPAGTDLDPVTLTTVLDQAPTCAQGVPVVSAATAGSVTVRFTPGTCTAGTALSWELAVETGGGDGIPVAHTSVPLATPTATLTGLPAAEVLYLRVSVSNRAGAAPRQESIETVLPFRSIGAFTDRQFQDLRLRPPTTAERTSWTNQIRQGTATPAQLVVGLVDGPEWGAKQSPVIRLFQAYFLRLPDAGGLTYWTTRSRNGTRLGAISSNFAGSNEFKTRYGSLTNRAFVELVYDNVLGRPGDPGGITSWTNKLNNRTRTRGEVMIGFSESNEYKNRTVGTTDVVNAYTGLLRRVPTAAEVTAGAAQPRTTLVHQLLASPAYDARIP